MSCFLDGKEQAKEGLGAQKNNLKFPQVLGIISHLPLNFKLEQVCSGSWLKGDSPEGKAPWLWDGGRTELSPGHLK